MKMISQSRAEKLAKLYEVASRVCATVCVRGTIHSSHDAVGDLIRALGELDEGRAIPNPMQVLDGD